MDFLLHCLKYVLQKAPFLEKPLVAVILFLRPIYFQITTKVLGKPPEMEIWSSSDATTTNIMHAAAVGEVTDEAVDFFCYKHGAKGVEYLERAAEEGRREHLPNNAYTIMKGIIRARLPFSSEIAMAVLYNYSDNFKGATGEEQLQEFVDEVFLATPGMSPEEQSKCASEMLAEHALSESKANFIKNYVLE
jgi:hypothetical protein